MKMSRESYEHILQVFAANKEAIKEHAPNLERYKNFERRLVADCMMGFIGSRWICDRYDDENLNDDHIFTAGRRALKELNIL